MAYCNSHEHCLDLFMAMHSKFTFWSVILFIFYHTYFTSFKNLLMQVEILPNLSNPFHPRKDKYSWTTLISGWETLKLDRNIEKVHGKPLLYCC